MQVCELPYNRLLGITPGDENTLLRLEFRKELLNHHWTVHAAALFSLAEASSAEFLLRTRGDRDDIVGVVRKGTCKYSAPATTNLHSRSSTPVEDLAKAIRTVDAKGRALVTISVELLDQEEKRVAIFTFDWFITTQES